MPLLIGGIVMLGLVGAYIYGMSRFVAWAERTEQEQRLKEFTEQGGLDDFIKGFQALARAIGTAFTPVIQAAAETCRLLAEAFRPLADLFQPVTTDIEEEPGRGAYRWHPSMGRDGDVW